MGLKARTGLPVSAYAKTTGLLTMPCTVPLVAPAHKMACYLCRFARQVDVETSPEADTPRPCGVALLECMLERAQAPVAAALLALAAQLQVSRSSPYYLGCLVPFFYPPQPQASSSKECSCRSPRVLL